MHIVRRVPLACATFGLMIVPTVAFANCDALGKWGVYDFRESTSKAERASTFRHWFCKNHFESASLANSAAADIGIPVEDIPLHLGYSSKSGSYTSWRDSYCQDDSGSESSLAATTEFVATINSSVVAIVEKCYNRAGVHVAIKEGADPHIFHLPVRYVLGLDNNHPILESFYSSASPPMNCQQDFKAGDEILSSGKTVICKRTSDEPVEIALNAIKESVLLDTPMSLPAIVPPPAPDTVRREACRQIFDGAWDVGQATTLYSEGMDAYLVSRELEVHELGVLRFPGTDKSANIVQYTDNQARAAAVKKMNNDVIASKVAEASHLKDYVAKLKSMCSAPLRRISQTSTVISGQECENSIAPVYSATDALYSLANSIKTVISTQQENRMKEWLAQERPNDPTWRIDQYNAAKDRYSEAQNTMDNRVSELVKNGNALKSALSSMAVKCHL